MLPAVGDWLISGVFFSELYNLGYTCAVVTTQTAIQQLNTLAGARNLVLGPICNPTTG